MKSTTRERIIKRISTIAKTIQKRRPFWDDKPDGLLESDRDFVDNNHRIAVELLELVLELKR